MINRQELLKMHLSKTVLHNEKWQNNEMNESMNEYIIPWISYEQCWLYSQRLSLRMVIILLYNGHVYPSSRYIITTIVVFSIFYIIKYQFFLKWCLISSNNIIVNGFTSNKHEWLNPLNPSSPHDALKHHFTSLNFFFFFLQLGSFRRKKS